MLQIAQLTRDSSITQHPGMSVRITGERVDRHENTQMLLAGQNILAMRQSGHHGVPRRVSLASLETAATIS